MPNEKIVFKGEGGQMLAARLDKPDGIIKAYAIFAHCFTGTKDILSAKKIAETLVQQGIAVFRFDFTGLGESEGDFANTNFSSNVDDLISASKYMAEYHEAPDILIGHSLGGTAVLAAAKHVSSSKAIVTIGSPADAAHVAHTFSDYKEQILSEGAAEVCLAGRVFTIKKQFLEDIDSIKMQGCVQNLEKALLIMHAPRDEVVGIENAGQLFSWAKHPKSYVSLDDAEHLLMNRNNASYAANIIAAWVVKYIG